MKIDVQGFKYEVLTGGKKTISECQPILLIETPGKKELEFLLKYQYKPFVYKHSRLDPGMAGLNVFFIPEPLQGQLMSQ